MTRYEWLCGLNYAERARLLGKSTEVAKKLPQMTLKEVAGADGVCPQILDRAWYDARYGKDCGDAGLHCEACARAWLEGEK